MVRDRRGKAVGLLLALLAAAPAPAQEQPSPDETGMPARIYTTREERRDAGLRHEVTDGLTVSGLLELEGAAQQFALRDDDTTPGDSEYSGVLELSAELEPAEWLTGEVIYEIERESETGWREPGLDEATAAVEVGAFELEGGRLYVPFGEYFSHFVSGPILEFGETRGAGAKLSWSPDDRLDVAAFTLRGRARPLGQRRRDWDWGVAVEASPFAAGTFAASYLSDLADSEERLLEDSDDRYVRRVPALSGYAALGAGDVEMTAEYVGALRGFRELDADRNRPCAWNVELAYFPLDPVQVALRAEGSREIEDEPDAQYGIAVAWRFLPVASITVEYLRGRYRRGLAEDGLERELEGVDQVAAQVGIEL